MAAIRDLSKDGEGRPTGRSGWCAQIYLGKHPDTGKHRFKTKTFAREKDALKWARKQEGQKDDGLLGAMTATRMTLAAYLTTTWLPTYRTQVRSTYNTEKTLGKWILNPRDETPFLGKLPLDKLTVDNFDRLYVAMQGQGMGTRGIGHLHGILVKAFNDAVRKKHLVFNPARDATVPKADVQTEIVDEHDEQESEVQYLNHDQAVRFLAAAQGDRWSALWHLLFDAGLRPGEAFALKWRHVDLERRMVKVRGTLTRVGVVKAGGNGWKVMPPKTKASVGDVPISAATMSELRRWKAQQGMERLRLGPEWLDHGFVFTTEFGSPLGNNVGRAWTRVLATADGGKGDLGTWGPEPTKPKHGPTAERKFFPRFVPYVLRHTCATLLLLDGMDLLSVSRRLRHKNITITARFYGHVEAKHTTQAAESFDRLAASV